MGDLDFAGLIEAQGDQFDPNDESPESYADLLEAEGDQGVVVPYGDEDDQHPLEDFYEAPDRDDLTLQENISEEGQAWELFATGDWNKAQEARIDAEERIRLLQHRAHSDFKDLFVTASEEEQYKYEEMMDELGLPLMGVGRGHGTQEEWAKFGNTAFEVGMGGMIAYSIGAPMLLATGVGATIIAGGLATIKAGVGITGFMLFNEGLDYTVRTLKGFEKVDGVHRGFSDLFFDTTYMGGGTINFLAALDEAAKFMAFGLGHKTADKMIAKYVPKAKLQRAVESVFKEVVKYHAPDKSTMFIKPAEVMKSLGIITLRQVTPTQLQQLKQMGLTPFELAYRIKLDIDVEMPTETIFRVIDKAWWKKLKESVRFSSHEESRVDLAKLKAVADAKAATEAAKPVEAKEPVKDKLDEELGEVDIETEVELDQVKEGTILGEETKWELVEADVAEGKGIVEEYAPEKVESVAMPEAIEKGLISQEEADVIQGLMEFFPEAWQEHFDVKFSGQEFRPTAEQLKAHGVPKSKADDMRIHGAVFTEKIGPMLEDARHVATLFKGSNIGNFIHEYGHFVERRILSRPDKSFVKRMHKESGSKKDRQEWFADEWRDWWFQGGKEHLDPKLRNIFRRMLQSVKSLYRSLRGKQESPLSPLFEDIVTNGREFKEKFFYSDKEIVIDYILGSEPTDAVIRQQGITENSKTLFSYDPSTMCPKQQNFTDFLLKNAEEYNMEWSDLADPNVLSQMYDFALAENIDVPCSYCYVEKARRKAITFHAQGKAMTGVNFAMAKKVYKTVPYKDALRKWSSKKIAEVNKRGGLRLFSFSDYIPEYHRAEITKLLADAKEMGIAIKAITKVPEFVDHFGDTGILINLSVDYTPKGGPAIDWDVAMAYRAKYKNVKIRTVARNVAEVEAMLKHPDIEVDVVTPYHHDNAGKAIPTGFEDMSGRSVGGKKLRNFVEENPDFASRICCQVGGKCFTPKHQEQCAANCGNLAGNLNVPADVGNAPNKGMAENIAKRVATEAKDETYRKKSRYDKDQARFEPRDPRP
ncbi:MAG: hypothetical protein ACYSW8_27760, partial [Planctomycetota bacterium]